MYEPNKYFLKRETGPQFGGTKVMVMTPLPRMFSEDDALTLAADLVKLAGGPVAFGPVLAAAYGGPAAVQAAIDKTLAEKKAAAPAKNEAKVAAEKK